MNDPSACGTPDMPRSASPRISRSCAAARIRRTMCIRPASSAFPRSALPITTRWPAWCGPIRNSAIPRSQHKPKLLIGARLVFIDGTPDILVYPRDRDAYGRLCQLLTRGKRGDDISRIEKGECHLTLDDLLEFAEGQLLVLTLPHRFETANALEDSGALEAQPRRRRLAGRKPALSRRRQAPAGAAASHRRDAARAAARDQRGAVPPSRAPPAAGCADLHPREDHHRRRRQAAAKPMPSAISSRRMKWRGCFANCPRRSRKPCGLPTASRFRSISSDTNIRTSRCRRARPRSSIWKI